jgi:hypothetical protein
LRLAGRTTEEIRADLARNGTVVSHGTVMSDLKEIKRAWQLEYAQTYDEHCALQLAMIDAGIAKAAREYLGNSDPAHGHIYARLLRERSRLLGTDSPLRIEAQIKVREYDSRLDEEIEALLALFDQQAPALDVGSRVNGDRPGGSQEPDPIRDALSGLPMG